MKTSTILYFLLFSFFGSQATSFVWTNANGTNIWSDPANWNQANGTPGAGDTAKFIGQYAQDCIIDMNVFVGSIEITPNYSSSITQLSGSKVEVGQAGFVLNNGQYVNQDELIVYGNFELLNGEFLTGPSGLNCYGNLTLLGHYEWKDGKRQIVIIQGDTLIDRSKPVVGNTFHKKMHQNNYFDSITNININMGCLVNTVSNAQNSTVSGPITNVVYGSHRSAINVQPAKFDGPSDQHVSAETVSINVYPNPATDRLSVELNPNEPGMASVRLIDLSGKTINSWTGELTERTSVEFNISAYPKGMYFVQVEGEKSEMRKVMKF